MAQTTSPLGRFSVDYVKGCSPLTVQVTDLSGSGVSVYQYEGSTSSTTNQTSYIYIQSGQYYLVQTIQNLSPRQDSLLIEVMDPLPPEFEIFSCENLGASVLITDNVYDRYEVDFGDNTIVTTPIGSPTATHFYGAAGNYSIQVRGIYTNALDNCATTTKNFSTINAINPAVISSLSMIENGDMVLNYTLGQNIFYDIQIAADNGTIFQNLKSISNQSVSDTIKGLNQSRDYCFRIISYDPCANNTIISNLVCSLGFEAIANDGSNTLNWNSVSGVATTFDIERDQTIINTSPGTDNSYQDNNIDCNLEYCYVAYANFSGGARAVSISQCVTTFSTAQPSAITDISITVDRSSVDAEWIPPSGFTVDSYLLEGNVLNTGFNLIDSLTGNSYDGLDSAGCFRVKYVDACGNLSLSSPVGCQLLISFLENQTNLDISWNDYSGWSLGVARYMLEVYDQNDNLISVHDAGLSTAFSLDLSNINEQVIKVRVTADPNATGITSVSSDFITYIREPVINLPRAFTPDGDGLNDFYAIIGKFIDSIEFTIFDRWGKIVFTEKELGSGWDGLINGKPAPGGAYVYNVEIIDFAGRTFKRSGSFVLLR